MTAVAPASVVAVTAALLRWRHRRGAQAQCLLRVRILHARSAGGDERVTVAVASELRGNPRGMEIGADFAGLATAACGQFLLPTLEPASVLWYAHHGEFSSYDPTGPPTMTRVPLRWDGIRYQEPPLVEHDLLDRGRYLQAVAELHLEPVAELLAGWGWSSTTPGGDDAAMRG